MNPGWSIQISGAYARLSFMQHEYGWLNDDGNVENDDNDNNVDTDEDENGILFHIEDAVCLRNNLLLAE